MNDIVQVQNLEVRYGKTIAIRDMTVSLPRGEIIGLVGENGSGKTTFMRILAGMIQRYKGTVTVNGNTDTWSAKESVCYYPSNPYFDGKASIEQTIRLYASLYRQYDCVMAYDMFERFGFDVSLRLNQLSKGKCALAMFILQLAKESHLYIFDEPFSGIDIKTRSMMKEVLLHHVTPEKTYLISTHEIADMESLFDRIVMMQEGKMILNEISDTLRDQSGKSIADIVKEAS